MIKKSSAAAKVGCIRVVYLGARAQFDSERHSWSFYHAIRSAAEQTPSAADK